MTKVLTRNQIPVAGKAKGILRLLRIPILQCAVLVALLVSRSTIEAIRLKSLENANSWLQLQVGNWIMAHRAIPRYGIFSQSSAMAWADPNWGLQMGLAVLYRMIGIRGIPVGVMVLDLLFTMAMFVLAGGRRGNFWFVAAIALWAQIALSGLSPVPTVLCSASMFALELALLLRSRADGGQKLLYGVPLLIVVWVNVDWHSVLGVIVVILFCLVNSIQPLLRNNYRLLDLRHKRDLPPALLGSVAGATGIASLISPSSYHSYVTAWQSLFGVSPLTNSLLTKPLNFREPQHYLLMLLAMCAFFVVGRQQARDVFQILLLPGCASLSFAFRPEAWVIVVASVAVIGELVAGTDTQVGPSMQISNATFRSAVAAATLVLIIAATRIPSVRNSLLEVAAKELPVRACDFIRRKHLPTPIYNELSWGDFLAWYLPEYPVSIDDRYELYGEGLTAHYYEMTTGRTAPAFSTFNTILLSTSNVLIQAPNMYPNVEDVFHFTFPGFQEVYRDELAVVLTRQP